MPFDFKSVLYGAIITAIVAGLFIVTSLGLAILAGGHALLVGVPGLAKTKLVETLGTVLGLDDLCLGG